MAVMEFDGARAEAFGGATMGTVAGAMFALSVSLGHRTGLYDVMSELDPATSSRIAERSGLQERYVREWLAGQLAGGVVEYDPAAETWWLPREHAAALTRSAGAGNVAFLATAIARFADLEDDVLAAFRNGGGVPWSRMGRVQAWQSELSYGVYHHALAPALGLVPGFVERLREGIDVVDVGCGHGHAALRLADSYPASRFVGYDQAPASIAAASAEAQRLGLRNVRFEVRDAASLDPEGYDFALALDVIHDLARPYAALAAIHAALRPGGALLMAEHALSHRPQENASHPLAALLYTVSMFHCLTASLSEGGEGLGIAWGEERIRAALADAGFSSVEMQVLEGDPFNAFYSAKRD
ncbi:MAG TPA: methyltransferase domain-containing protein [Thermoleophilaceae bacterium]|nr:methyltransferase domain-containing protein [Thermoleophilaceae bacterium]